MGVFILIKLKFYSAFSKSTLVVYLVKVR